MCEVTGLRNDTSIELFGLAEYYDAIFRRAGLVKKETEFRSFKLSLVLDFIRAIDISERLAADLASAIVTAWRLQVPEKTQKQREEELHIILDCIEKVKSEIEDGYRQGDPPAERHLDAVVLSGLPVLASDLDSNHASVVDNLMNQVSEHSLISIKGKLIKAEKSLHCSNKSPKPEGLMTVGNKYD